MPHRKRRGPISQHLGARTTDRIHSEIADLRRKLDRPVDVLDVGCGTKLDPSRGYSYIHGLEHVAGTYLGIDPSAECAAISSRAGSRLERFPAGEVARAAGEAIPLPDDTVDVVLMVASLDHAVDPEKVLAECRRVLRPDGLLIIQSGTHRSWLLRLLRRLLPARMRTRDAADHHIHIDAADIRGMVSGAGFEHYRIRESGYLTLPPRGRSVEAAAMAVGSLVGRKRFLRATERLDGLLAKRAPGYGSRVLVTARVGDQS